jgi:hypothetical protein
MSLSPFGMTVNLQSPNSARNAKMKIQPFANEITQAVLISLLRLGVTRQDLLAACFTSVASDEIPAGLRIDGKGKSRLVDAQAFGSVLATWHSNPKYLTHAGEPKPLPIRGATNSIFEIFRKHGYRGVEEQALSFMLQQKLLVRTSNRSAKPKSISVQLRNFDRVAFYHACNVVESFLNTFLYNFSRNRRAPALFERTTETRTLTESLHGDFCSFANSQIYSAAKTINDWLEAKSKIKLKGEKRLIAGAHFFAYSRAPEFRPRFGRKKASSSRTN